MIDDYPIKNHKKPVLFHGVRSFLRDNKLVIEHHVHKLETVIDKKDCIKIIKYLEMIMKDIK